MPGTETETSRPLIKFKPVRWKTLPRDFLAIQAGFALFGFSIAMLIQAGLGTGPWVVLEVALARLSGISIGTMIVLMGAAVLSGAVLLREPIGWGTIGNILFIGPWTDLSLRFLPPGESLPVQVGMLLFAILLMGMATAIYISVDAGAGPRDSLMLAIERVTGWSLRAARTSIEVIVVVTGWLLGGPAGAGTVVFALLIGPAVQWGFRLFRVES